MHRQTQLCCLSSILLFLPLCMNTTGSIAFPNDEYKTESWDNNSTQRHTTTTPRWITNQSSGLLLTKITKRPSSTSDIIVYITGGIGDDYYDDEEVPPTRPPHMPVSPCPYDHCKHLEPPCEESQKRAENNCLCPGVQGPTIRPDVPKLRQIVPGDRDVAVSWCSPMSTVHGYRVLHGPQEGLLERGPVLNTSHRFYSIAKLLPGTAYKVCVVAFNRVGESPVDTEDEHFEQDPNTSGPCRIINTTSKYLYIYIGLGLTVLAVLMVLAIIGYCICKRRRGSKTVEWNEADYPY
ncbi:LRRN4 C-terminal-like protein [Pelobates fuscus]|uniref:LRRN4 C-terminal-like protein n=1 Tax=Pelobates fuscus TaxID=191477 RepID=UPI002FE4EB4B